MDDAQVRRESCLNCLVCLMWLERARTVLFQYHFAEMVRCVLKLLHSSRPASHSHSSWLLSGHNPSGFLQ